MSILQKESEVVVWSSWERKPNSLVMELGYESMKGHGHERKQTTYERWGEKERQHTIIIYRLWEVRTLEGN